MSDNGADVVGKWTVSFKSWVWEYTFSGDGTVTWRDPLNDQTGSGRWISTGKLINLFWIQSSTAESWRLPISPADQTGWVTASYGSGALKAQKVVTTTALPPASGIPGVNPAIANIPWDPGYVDMFLECIYDVNFKIPPDQSFAFSSTLQIRYSDGVAIELDIAKDFSSQDLSPLEARNAMAQGNVGRGNRIFPTALTPLTTPRLWKIRDDAFRVQNESEKEFEKLAVVGVAVALTVPAMPAGAAPDEAVATTKVTRRSVPPTEVPPAPIQGNMVRLGSPGAPGNLFASIQATAQEVVYRVDMIVLEGKGPAVATARATHRAMIKRAAQTAQSAGLSEFKMIGKQANENFVRHADKVAQEIGVAGSGKRVGVGSPGFSDYEVILVVTKALGLP
jgi:hypothetical protein